MKARYIKLLGIAVGLAVVNIAVFSPGFIGLAIRSSALSAAFGATLLLASALALIYATYTLIFKPPAAVPVKEIETHEDYVEALSRYGRVKVLKEDMAFALQQLDRIGKKKDTLFDVLRQRFDSAELSYIKFASVIQEVEKLFYQNLRSVLNRLGAFDEAEYESVMAGHAPRHAPALLQERRNVYSEYLTFTKTSIAANEEILLKLDKLLLEISRLDSFEVGDIERMPCMREIDALIKQTQYYKH